MKAKLRLLVFVTATFLGIVGTTFAATATANVAKDGTAYANQPLYGGASPQTLIDGDIGLQVHGDVDLQPGFAYTVDLGRDYSISELKVFPRQDGCCAERLTNFRISVHADNGGTMGAEVWGADEFTDGTNPGSGAGKVVSIPLPAPTTGRWIEIRSLANPVPNYALQINELQVIAQVQPLEIDRALGAIATANQPTYLGTSAANLVDGNRVNQVHGTADIQPGFAYDINLGVEVDFDHINVFARQDGCCAERLSNYRVEVHKDNAGVIGDTVWAADLHTDGSNPGSFIGAKDLITKDLDPTNTFKGQWLRIVSLDDPVPQYALQITEVEVFGGIPDAVKLLISSDPANAVAGTGATATFNVGANVINGDTSQISYQWQRNGSDIAGATNATYTTPALLASDNGAKFRAIVSYPGQTNLTSAEATLRINLAYGATVTVNGPLWGPGNFHPSDIVDGSLGNFIHGDADLPTGFAYTMKLGSSVKFDTIDIFPRQDGFGPERLKNIHVSVHSDNNGQIGNEVWGADLFTSGDAGAGPGVVDHVVALMDAAGKFEGRWIQIQALDDPVPSYFLQIAEVEAFGTLLDTTPRLSILNQSTNALSAPGRTTTLSVTASVFNGNPTNITYQWRKDGVPISGATNATYTTPVLQQNDLGAKYTVAISYPGIPDVISAAAPVTFDYNYARGSAVTSNRKLWVGIPTWTPAIIVNGDRSDFVHGDTAITPGMAYDINMGDEVNLQHIDIYPRQDGCCGERLSNIRVSIHKDNNGQIGDTVWSADLFTDGSNAGSGPGVVVNLTPDLDPTGTFKGQWIRIESLADPLPDYSMQISEVEAVGTITLRPTLTFNSTRGLTLMWTDGVLQSAPDITGPWSVVTGETSPYSPPKTDPRTFFRLQKAAP